MRRAHPSGTRAGISTDRPEACDRRRLSAQLAPSGQSAALSLRARRAGVVRSRSAPARVSSAFEGFGLSSRAAWEASSSGLPSRDSSSSSASSSMKRRPGSGRRGRPRRSVLGPFEDDVVLLGLLARRHEADLHPRGCAERRRPLAGQDVVEAVDDRAQEAPCIAERTARPMFWTYSAARGSPFTWWVRPAAVSRISQKVARRSHAVTSPSSSCSPACPGPRPDSPEMLEGPSVEAVSRSSEAPLKRRYSMRRWMSRPGGRDRPRADLLPGEEERT